MPVLRWIPNLISLARIALVPMVVAAIASERFELGAALFFAAGFSDGVDGWLARRFDWRTELGAILDPIADKLLLIGTFLVLLAGGLTPWWLGLVVIVRDVLIMAGAITYHFLYGDLEGRPSLVSKLNTVLLLVYVVVVLLGQLPLPDGLIRTVLLASYGLTAALMVTMTWSTIDYVREWIGRAREHTAND